MINLQDIVQAQTVLKGVVHETHLDYSKTFSDLSHNSVYIKLENLQKTGSFKVRGAYNKIISLNKDERKKGVVAASAGNHAQGVAFASSAADIKSTIVMPKGAPLAKIEATKKYGANVILHGDVFDEALDHAFELQSKTNATFVHPFDDYKIIAGQGTIGLEILGQLSNVDAVICPIGGGGLIAGVAMALKETNPKIKVFGVEASSCPSMTVSLTEKKPTKVIASDTIADGIAVKRPGDKTFEMIQNYVDGIVTVSELEISRTMLYLLERNKLLVEGSGAVSLAALLFNKIPIQGKNVVPIISGGNVDVKFISRVIEHGLAESGRFVTFTTLIPDKPGHLNKLLSIISNLEANVLNIHHQRIGSRVVPGQTEIEFSLETRDRIHIREIANALTTAGYEVVERM
ncbi:threonine ammonia-lyase [Bacillus sp. Marseille-P3661]|uniref:threonine ammonia-lyase n=1 Tax=Bacillus sp. Marseille-P3661 TaxID=1936234 RepID=UPI000C82D19A|nr:threonine ammonia-lyase [Bacillus sp. Marseille-P3661]